jgi:hypothetical protein
VARVIERARGRRVVSRGRHFYSGNENHFSASSISALRSTAIPLRAAGPRWFMLVPARLLWIGVWTFARPRIGSGVSQASACPDTTNLTLIHALNLAFSEKLFLSPLEIHRLRLPQLLIVRRITRCHPSRTFIASE